MKSDCKTNVLDWQAKGTELTSSSIVTQESLNAMIRQRRGSKRGSRRYKARGRRKSMYQKLEDGSDEDDHAK